MVPGQLRCHTPAAGGPLRYDATVVLVVDPAGFGASMRVAVIDVPTRCPSTRTVVPTGKLDAEPGACNVPKAVLGVKVTVNETPLAVLTVHTPPLTAVTVPRTPGCLARAPPAPPAPFPGGVVVAGALADGGDAWAGPEDPDPVTA